MKFLAVLTLLLCSCAGLVVDEDVYRKDVAFNEALLLAVSRAALQGAETAAAEGNLPRCELLARDALVAEAHAAVQARMSLYAAGLGDDPGPLPPVLSAHEWCATRHGEGDRS